jgi:hypothetical protein
VVRFAWTRARVVPGSSRMKSSQAISILSKSESSPWRSSSEPRSWALCHKASLSDRFLFSVFSLFTRKRVKSDNFRSSYL